MPGPKGKPHGFYVGEKIPQLDAVIVGIRTTRLQRPSSDYVTIRHGCCGHERGWQAHELKSRIRKATSGETVWPELCSACVRKMYKRAESGAAHQDWIGVRAYWSPPGIKQSYVSYYGDTR